jgi:hypothetical protein
LNRWYKYVKKNKGDKKDTYQSTFVLEKMYLFVHQKDNPQKPPTKVKRTRDEMQTTLLKKKVARNFPRSAFKRKNIVEEGGTLGSRVKRE